jgi:glycosyltransferase involved in cell wall biosynthesis
VHLISFESSEEHIPGIHIHSLKLSNLLIEWLFYRFGFIQKAYIRPLLETIQPDIFHAIDVAVCGIIAADLDYHPLIISAIGSDVLIAMKTKRKDAIVNALRKADLVHCAGENISQAVKNAGIDPNKLVEIKFGVDTERFKPDINLREKVPTVISTRNLAPVYDVITLIEAIPLVLEKYPNTRFIIAGWGPLKESLIRRTKELKIESHTMFIGKFSNEEMPAYLNGSSIYVSTAISDGGLAVSTAEAMSCGLPVIVSDYGGIKKWIKDFENGFVIPSKSPSILAERILFLLENPEIGRKYGENNRNIILQDFNYEKEMVKLEGVYFKLIK